MGLYRNLSKLSENQVTNMSDDTVSNSIIICGSNRKYTAVFKANIPTLNLKLNYVCIFEKILVSLIMYAILVRPLILGNKINLKSKQDVSGGL